jgi:pimeloyl-ACP methyl ester carboxylesterase
MKVIVNNLAVEYEDQGNRGGNVMLFLHGWKNNLHSFDLIVPDLLLSCRIVRLDLPGFGGSEMPSIDWDLDDYVDFVGAFTKKVGIRCDVLIGHSLGGRIAIKGLARHIFSPSKIVLIASAGIAEIKPVRRNIIILIAKAGKALTAIPPLSFMRERLRKFLYRKIGSDYGTAGVLSRVFVNIVREDLSESARAITVPALLIWGDRDTETPVSDGERLSRLIPGSRLAVIPGAGHFVHQERPREVVEIIKSFLSSTDTNAR